jgi:archaellum component FlaG (FlaF/FlaG flagellin family)
VNVNLLHKNIVIASTIAFAALLLVTLLAYGALVTSKTIKTSGILASANLGVYSDSACAQSFSSIDWGIVSPSSSASKTFYIKNMGSSQLTLTMSVTNWDPSTANGPVTLNWNRQGATLAANQVLSATLTITVSSDASGLSTFAVDVVITGTA